MIPSSGFISWWLFQGFSFNTVSGAISSQQNLLGSTAIIGGIWTQNFCIWCLVDET